MRKGKRRPAGSPSESAREAEIGEHEARKHFSVPYRHLHEWLLGSTLLQTPFPEDEKDRDNDTDTEDDPDERRFESLRSVASLSERKDDAKDRNGGKYYPDPIETFERVLGPRAGNQASRSDEGGTDGESD